MVQSQFILLEAAKKYAIQCHQDTNHKYDGRPYSVHLQMVYDYGVKYNHLIGKHTEQVLAACWTHDVIEDCRQTYNDVHKATQSLIVAEITYALTNEKGRNRKERANKKYYKGIKETHGAAFVKICDRLANIRYSKDSGSKMLDVYKKEFNQFFDELFAPCYHEMFVEMGSMLSV